MTGHIAGEQALQGIDMGDSRGLAIGRVHEIGEAVDEFPLELLIHQQPTQQQGGPGGIAVQAGSLGGAGGEVKGIIGIGQAGAIGIDAEPPLGVEEDPAPAAPFALRTPVLDVVAGPVAVIDIDLHRMVGDKVLNLHLALHPGVILRLGEVLAGDEIAQGDIVVVAALEHTAVQFELIDLVGVAAVVLGEIMFVHLLAQVEDTPIFAVEIDGAGTVGLAVEVDALEPGVDEAVGEEGAVPVVAAVAQDEGVVIFKGQLGEEAVVELLLAVFAPGKEGHRLLRAGAAPAAKNARAGVLAETRLSARLEEFDMDRPLPVLPEIGAVIGILIGIAGSEHIDAILLVPEVAGIGGQRNHRQGSGRLAEDKGMCDDRTRIEAGGEGARPDDSGGADADGSATERRKGIGLAAVARVADRRTRGRAAQGEGEGLLIKAAAFGELGRGGLFGDLLTVVGLSRCGHSGEDPLVAAIRHPGPGEVRG